MRFTFVLIIAVLLVASLPSAGGVTSRDLLARVKSAEASLADMRAEMVITEADKKNVRGMGEGYGDLLKLQKAVILYKKPDLIRYDGYARGIRATYIQNGYTKLIIAAMVRHKEDVRNDPGKRQDTLDLGFLSSRLWTDNRVTVVSTERNGSLKLKFVPKFGDRDERHDMVWVDPGTLRVLKREKYRGSGELRVKMVYSDFERLTEKLPIATTSNMFNNEGESLGSVAYRGVKVNTGLVGSLFSLSTR